MYNIVLNQLAIVVREEELFLFQQEIVYPKLPQILLILDKL